jgi:hypothetical protein
MAQIRQESRRGERASVLPLALIMVVILFVTGIGLLRLAFYSRLQAIVSTAGISARAAADAGITQALHEMNKRFDYGQPWDNSWIPYSASDDLSGSAYGSAGYNFDITGPTAG